MAHPSARPHSNTRAPTAREPMAPTRTDQPHENQDDDAEAAAVRPEVRMGTDIGFDRVVGADEAGLGGGLDQAEEAQLGITDEELQQRLRERSGLK